MIFESVMAIAKADGFILESASGKLVELRPGVAGKLSRRTVALINALGFNTKESNVLITGKTISYIKGSHPEVGDEDVQYLKQAIENPDDVLPNIGIEGKEYREKSVLLVYKTDKNFVAIVEITPDKADNILWNFWKISPNSRAESYLAKFRKEKAKIIQSGGRPLPHVPHYMPDGKVGKPEGLSGSQTEELSFDKKILYEKDIVNKILESIVQPNQKPTIAQDQSKRAMKNTLDTQKNTMQGASRLDIGWIAFLWGNAGTAPLFADGDGLARIIAKQDFEKKYLPSERSGRELCMRLVDMLTRGFIKRKYGPSSRPKVDLSWQGEIATVSWDPDRKTWYLAAWREDWGGILESAAPAMAKDMKKTLDALVNAIIKDNISSRSIHRDYIKNITDDQLQALKNAGYINWKIARGNVNNIALLPETQELYKMQEKADDFEFNDFSSNIHNESDDMLEALLKSYLNIKSSGVTPVGFGKNFVKKLLPQYIKIIEAELAKRKADIPVAETAPIDVDGLRIIVSIDNNQAKDIPPGWIVFNAPRPMYGDKEWQGDPGHGMLYGAVDPQGAGAEWMVKDNKSLDGWIYQDISAATMTAMVRQNYLDGYFKNDAAKVDAAMAKISIEQIRGQFFNVLEKLNYGTFKALLAKATEPSVTIDKWRLDIRAATTFQNIADVFEREFGVTAGDDPVMETAILEGWEDDLVSGVAFNDDNWKNKLRAATTFDDIYLAFKASGIMVDYMPDKPQDAASLFNRADQFEPLVGDYISAETAIARLETSELISKAIFADRAFSPGLLAKVIPGYESIKPKSELLQEAGKEIFENAKAKGEELVTAWQYDPDIIPTAQQISNKRAALESLEKERSAVEVRYCTDRAAMKAESEYKKLLDEFTTAADMADEYIKTAYIAYSRVQKKAPGSPEYFKLQEAFSAATINKEEIVNTLGKVVKDAREKLTTSDEYLNLKSEYLAAEESFDSRKKQLNRELSDAIAKTYNPLIQKMLEASPVTEKQAKNWASGQVIDKSVIKELAVETLIIGPTGTRTTGPVYSEANIRNDMAELYRLSGGRFGKCHILPRVQGQNRASADLGQRSIHAGDELTKRTLWHEMGHLIENDTKYVIVSNEFLNGRVDKTKGLIKLSVLTGDVLYGNDEVAYTDHLFSAYVGKYYGGSPTEVLSMGIQQFSSPELMHELGLKDPEMFKMILGILATPPSGSEKERLTGELNQAKSDVDAQKAVDAFYKMLDKKIKKNPLFYEPFATFKSVSGYKKKGHSDGYYIISNEWDSSGHYLFQFSAKSKQIVLQLAYLSLALKQSGGDIDAFTRAGAYNVKIKDSIPTSIPSSWVTDGFPDIKAAN